MPTLVIGNKLYSSWSLRPWILMRHLGLPFEEVVIPLDYPQTTQAIFKYSPAGRVPVLIDDDLHVWDTLSIIEYIAETHPTLPVWPEERRARALARSIAAEMHSGFGALRSAMPMNLGKRFAHRQRGDKVERDVARIVALWRDARERYGAGGPFLFGAQFGAADAMFAPVVTRLDTYSWPVEADTRAYMDAVLALPAFAAWRSEALAEPWTIPADEVDEEPIEVLRAAGG